MTEGAVGNLDAAEGRRPWPFVWEAILAEARKRCAIKNAEPVTLSGGVLPLVPPPRIIFKHRNFDKGGQ